MRISRTTYRTVTVLSFILACLAWTGYLYAQAGGKIPGVNTGRGYTISFDTDNLQNLVPYSDAEEAGVPVGKVATLTRISPDTIRVVLTLDDTVGPLHEGATVQISEKSLAGQPYVKVTDGTGPPIAPDTVLPASMVKPSVTLRDVLASLDKPTRQALGGVIRSLGQSTAGREHDISNLMAGFSDVGHNGGTALDAVAAQSADLEQVSQQLQQIFEALDVGSGQIAQLVSSADRLTVATAGQRPALEASLRTLPGALDSATVASAHISQLSHALGPVAEDLRRAAPDLNDALDELPDASLELRSLLPPLHAVLGRAPATLDEVPDFDDSARAFFPPAVNVLRDLDPALRYLKPYGLDIAQFFTHFGAVFHHYGDDGLSYVYVRPVVNPEAVRPDPVKLPNSLYPSNPYPGPGGLRDLRPFTGTYPRVERDGG